MGELLTLWVYFSEIEAEIARGALESYGIPSLVLKDDCGGWMAELQRCRGVRLLVRGEDYEEARNVLGLDKERF